jgi:hypothetical protein
MNSQSFDEECDQCHKFVSKISSCNKCLLLICDKCKKDKH